MSQCLFQKEFDFGIFQTFDSKPDFECFRVHQVHGVDFNHENEDKKADGIYGKQTKAWAIITADCLPVVIHGKNGNVFFHAGWRGLADKIYLEPQVKAIEPFYAFIGPHICADKFEVQKDFYQHFPNSSSFLQHPDGKMTFDLLKELTAGLQSAYTGIQIDDAKLCTYKNDQFHSFRLDKTSKRNWNVFKSKTINI